MENTTTVSYSYDNNHKLISETYANDEVIRYTYNDNGDVTAQDRLRSRARASKVTKELSPLAGKVKCSVRGRAMKRNISHNKNKTKTYYRLY